MTNQEIITRGELIRDETVTGANTAQRVGEAFVAIGENLEEVKDITANQQESITDILGIKTFEFNFGKSATGGGYVSRFVEYQLVQGHTYRLSMETESDYTTYLSFRGDDGITIEGQTEIGKVIGSYTVDFECIADATRLYLTVKEAMEVSVDDKIFEASVIDLTSLSMQSIDKRLKSIEDGVTFVGAGSGTDVNVPLNGFTVGHTYALSFDDGGVSQISYLKVSSWNGDVETELQVYSGSSIIEPPLFLQVPEDSTSVILKVRATANVKVGCKIEDVTVSLKASGWAKVPMFELGQFYYDGTSGIDMYGQSNEVVRTKRGYFLHLAKGDVIGLSSYDVFKIQVVLFNPNGRSTISQWFTSDYTIESEGDYIIKIAPIVSGDTYESSEAIASLFRIKGAVSSDGEAVQSVLEMEVHSEERTIEFEKKGWFVKADGSLGGGGENTNWWESDPVHIYEGETVKIVCNTTTTGTPVIVKVNGDHSEFPSNEATYTPLVFGTPVKVTHTYTATEDCYLMLQYWQKTGSPSIFPDSQRLIGIEKRLTNVENGVTNIPSDYIEETNRLYRELRERAKYDASFVAFNTDQHFSEPLTGTGGSEDPVHTLRGLESLANIARRIPLDLIVLGGDVAGYDSNSQGVNDILDDINTLNKPFADINTLCISLSGNHDAYQNNRGITAQAMYNAHFKRGKWYHSIVHIGTDNLDAYFDDTDKKIRYIFADTYTQNGRSGIRSYNGNNQTDINNDIAAVVANFLHNALDGMAEGYKAVIFSHNPLTNEFDEQNKKKYYTDGTNERSAFEGSTDVHSTLDDYADKIIACICGHEHADAWGISDSGILYIVVTTSAPHTIRKFKEVDGEDEYFVPYARTMETVNETAFDIFSINTAEQTIEALRFGQGSNRKWKYGDNASFLGYRNCVSGKVSIPSLTLTFTESEDGQPISGGDVISVQCDADGRFEAYLKLATEYDISSDGHTLDTTYVEVNENVNLGYINIS